MLFSRYIRATTTDFWQARPPQWQPYHRHAAATAADTFYNPKSRQDLSLGGLACRDGPRYDGADPKLRKAFKAQKSIKQHGSDIKVAHPLSKNPLPRSWSQHASDYLLPFHLKGIQLWSFHILPKKRTLDYIIHMNNVPIHQNFMSTRPGLKSRKYFKR